MKTDDTDPLRAFAISPSMYDMDRDRSNTETHSPRSPTMAGPETTLTDISEYLTKHDQTLENAFKQAKYDLKTLQMEMKELKADFEKTFKSHKDCKNFVKKFDTYQSQLDEMLK